MQENISQLLKSNGASVNVIDAIMGSGKTTWMVDKINKDKNPKYIMVTPTLSEVARIKEDCPNAHFKEPETKQHTKKYYSLRALVKDGENIVTTHALFKYMTQDILADIKGQKYTLVIDEALACVEIYDEISPKDLSLLFNNNLVYVEPETYRLRWNTKEHGNYKGKFSEVKRRCDNGNLVYFKEKTMLWEFPVEFLNAFKDIWILTYMFKGHAMANYLKAEGTKDVMHSLRGVSSKGNPPELIKYQDNDEQAIKEIIRDNVVLYEGKLNDIGKSLNGRHNPFSKGWFDKASPSVIKTVKNNLSNYFTNHLKAKSEDIIWTNFGSMKKKGKGVRGKLQGKGYSKGFISNNTKATNNYIDKSAVAYMQNTFYHPTVKNYFTDRNVVVHDDLYSLSEMVQLIWRSRIRKNEKIFVYIPSSRMRYLFKAWLVSNNAQELAEEISANKQDGIFVEKGRNLYV